MGKVFICHRLEAARTAATLERELRQRFGEEQVLRDDQPLERKHAARLVLIDEGWASLRTSLGLGFAEGAVILPVLIEGASAPAELRAPPAIRALPLRQRRWRADVELIGEALERAGLQPVAGAGGPLKLIAGCVLGLVVALGLLDGDRDGSAWLAILGAAALGLAALAYRDHRHGRFPHLWPSLGALVVCGLPLVVALGGAAGSRPVPPQPAAVRVAATRDGGAGDGDGAMLGRKAHRPLTVAAEPTQRP
jgi:hypothetical protein